jgi:predicted DNA binding CopG/RHH family protein
MNKNKLKLDEEELKILHDFERGEFESIKNFQNNKKQLEKAAKEGISYQTLISSTLHKFITGKLNETA